MRPRSHKQPGCCARKSPVGVRRHPLCCLFASPAANATDWQPGMCSRGFAATPEATRLEAATLSTTPSGHSPLSPAPLLPTIAACPLSVRRLHLTFDRRPWTLALCPLPSLFVARWPLAFFSVENPKSARGLTPFTTPLIQLCDETCRCDGAVVDRQRLISLNDNRLLFLTHAKRFSCPEFRKYPHIRHRAANERSPLPGSTLCGCWLPQSPRSFLFFSRISYPNDSIVAERVL